VVFVVCVTRPGVPTTPAWWARTAAVAFRTPVAATPGGRAAADGGVGVAVGGVVGVSAGVAVGEGVGVAVAVSVGVTVDEAAVVASPAVAGVPESAPNSPAHPERTTSTPSPSASSVCRERLEGTYATVSCRDKRTTIRRRFAPGHAGVGTPPARRPADANWYIRFVSSNRG
jgi:hypothetical protein